ncbi:MAG: LytS/YehU family sensor histidine kinase [Bacteroidia bacterium]|jgi:LytS/YehU family sensor histidine kinase
MNDLELENSVLNSAKAFIGSHFMLNVLNSIQSDLLLGKSKEAFSNLQMYNRLLKMSLRSSNQTAHSAADEVKFLTDYVRLEGERFPVFKGKNILKITVSEDALEIPTFVLQSFIENALLLSLEQKENSIKVEIDANESRVNMQIKIQKKPEQTLHEKSSKKTELAMDRLKMLDNQSLYSHTTEWNKTCFFQIDIQQRH